MRARRVWLVVWLLVAMSSGLSVRIGVAGATPGERDQGFGDGGWVRLPVQTGEGVRDLVVLPDGGIVTASHAHPGVTVVRLGSNGRIDRSFGEDGLLTFRDLDGGNHPRIAVQTGPATGEWKLLVGLGGSIVRLHPDGKIDRTFADRGVLHADASVDSGLVVDHKGRIVLAWPYDTADPGPERGAGVAAARFQPDGQPDTSFGGTGRVEHDLSPNWDTPRAVAVDPQGRVLISGDFFAPNRCLPQPRPLQAGASVQHVERSCPLESPLSALVLLGPTWSNLSHYYSYLLQTVTDSGPYVARLLPDGALDRGFGDPDPTMPGARRGFATRGPLAEARDPYDIFTTAVAVQGDRILVSGIARADHVPGEDELPTSTRHVKMHTILSRYTDDGRPDLTFGVNGTHVAELATYDATADLAIQSDARIVIAGWGPHGFLVARLTPDGQRDRDFGSNGVVSGDAPDEQANALAVTDQHIIAGGGTTSDGPQVLLRLQR